MGLRKSAPDRLTALRKRARITFRAQPSELDALTGLSVKEMQALVQDLRVHQIELEIQNEELRRIHLEVEKAREKYRDLYDFAPVGYFTINEQGRILETNLTGAFLLGVDRQLLIGGSFHQFISSDTQDTFYFHKKYIFENRTPQTCELRLVKSDGFHFHAQLESVVFKNEAGDIRQFRMAVSDISDISKRKDAEESLRKVLENLEKLVKERTSELCKSNAQLEEKIKVHEQTERELQRSEAELRRFSSQILDAYENECKRIGAELHDSISQAVTCAKTRAEIALNQLDTKDTAGAKKSLCQIVTASQGTISEIQKISRKLRPSILDDLGILATISSLCREFEEIYPKININTQIQIQEEDIPDLLKTVIYRVLQEALSNIAKHSQAELVRISLIKTDGRIELEVGDNGRGYDLGEVNDADLSEKGLGLTSMKERTELSGGLFSIMSVEGTGSTIRVSWPVN